jgi:hypothetical protein
MPSLTYAELAEALGITPASANKTARRRRWPRHIGNDGRTRVTVPDEALVRQDSPPVSHGDSPPDNPVHALQAQVARLEGELVGVREALGSERARAEAAEAVLAEVRASRDREIERADQAERLLTNQRRPWWRRLAG